MNKPRIVLTGGSGLLALNWACAVRATWDVILGTHLHQVELAGTTSFRIDLEDPTQLGLQLSRLSPDLIVHTAGLTNVDGCEQDPVSARHANARIARNVALAAAKAGVRLIHISTDHLFGGESSFYREDAQPQPLNEYARTKLLAEQMVQEACPQAIIVRTNFFGWGSAMRQSFSDWIIQNLRAGKTLSLFDDVYVTPILADSLALTAHEIANSGASGIFNLVGEQRMSKYEFALQLAKRFGFPLQLIQPNQLASANLQAKRPHDMSLDNTKTRQLLGRNLGSLDEYLTELLLQEGQDRPSELMNSLTK